MFDQDEPASTYQPETFAMTGATGALGSLFLQAMLTTRPRTHAIVLARTTSTSFRSKRFNQLLDRFDGRITVIDGDLSQLNLSATQARRLTDTDGGLWHFAGATSLKAHEPSVAELAQRINEDATRQLLRLMEHGGGPFWHVSTAFVAGARSGTVREDELDCSQRFRNAFEASKARGEAAVRRCLARGMPGAIFRPSIVMENPPARRIANMAELCARAITRAWRKGEPFVLRLDPQASIDLVHADWLIAAMIDLARPTLSSRTPRSYHLTAPQPSPLAHLAVALKQWLPQVTINFAPQASSADMPDASRRFDRVFEDMKPYVQTPIRFDRSNALRDLSPGLVHNHFDFATVVRSRVACTTQMEEQIRVNRE